MAVLFCMSIATLLQRKRESETLRSGHDGGGEYGVASYVCKYVRTEAEGLCWDGFSGSVFGLVGEKVLSELEGMFSKPHCKYGSSISEVLTKLYVGQHGPSRK
jgi:hypothetical protein